MNEDYQPLPERSAFWPLLLLALSWGIVLLWQLTNITQQRSTVQQSQKQLDSVYQENVPKQEQLLVQSRAVQTKLETLVVDLLRLDHAGDADARTIVEKYKIQQNAPAAAASPALSP